jgi:DNA-binding CsgD family transcriptional regulator
MRKFLDTVQKQIGILISLVGLAVVVNNIVFRLFVKKLPYLDAITGVNVVSVFVLTLPFLVSIFIESSLLKKLQIGAFALMGTSNLIQSYQEFYGPALFLAAWLLTRHYGYLEKHAFAKNTAFIVVTTALSQVSASINFHEGIYAGLSTLLFTIFLVTLLVILWRDLVRQQKMLSTENESLRMDYSKLADQLRILGEEQKPYDLKAAKISPAEERVIKVLTLYKASNREIAERLKIAESTVKLHMYNICNKIGVDTRFAIIDLCKYNFL